jgi:hypothetical protein
MNAKEKAQDLFTTFRYALSHKDAPLGMYKDNIAIQCALIAVEEVIDQIYKSGEMSAKAQIEWWKRVKSELQSL